MRAACILPVLSWAAAAAPVVGHPWEPVGYQGFAESIDRLVGPDAIDCGFHDLRDNRLSEPERRQAYQCVQSALKRQQPFKFGTLRIPIDSLGYEVLARTPRGELWRVTYDLMLTDDESGQQWNRVCKSVGIDRATLVVHGDGCESKPDGRLDP